MSDSNNFFEDIQEDADIEKGGDSLGGQLILPTDIYLGVIKAAFGGKSSGGARSVTIHFQTESGKDMKETIYVTSGDAKGNKHYYERDGKKF